MYFPYIASIQIDFVTEIFSVTKSRFYFNYDTLKNLVCHILQIKIKLFHLQRF